MSILDDLNTMYGKPTVRTQNASVVDRSGAGGRQDITAGMRQNNFSSHPLDRTVSPILRGRAWVNLYFKEWTARKIVNIPVDDIMRGGWKYDGLDDAACKSIEKSLVRLQFHKRLRQALRLERLVGGCIMLMGIKGDENIDASMPLDPATVDKGDLAFINVIPRTRVTVSNIDSDPLSPGYGNPMVYNIYGQEVHKSRVLVFDGDPITQNQNDDLTYITTQYDSFGESVLAPIYDDIIRSMGSRQAALQLIHRASVLLIKNEGLQNMLEARGGKQNLEQLDNIADQMSIYQAAMIDGKKVDVDQYSASFGSVPELLEKYLQIISAASDIPATRFLGQAPGGLNATGESDLENYYNAIDARRESDLRVQLEKFFAVQMRSEFGQSFDPDKVEVEFESLWNLSETDLSTIRMNDTTNATNLVNAGVIGPNEAIEELKERGAWETEIKGDDEEMNELLAEADALLGNDIPGEKDPLNASDI